MSLLPGMVVVSPALVKEASELVHRAAGIQLGEKQEVMVKSRLAKRMLELRMHDSEKYLAYLRSNLVTETAALVSLLTTHHTFFFREFSHFEFMLKEALPRLLPVIRQRADRTLRIWSAACSRGQEAYSLAMYLDFHLRTLDPTLKFEILGTDVDTESVGIAQNGVYLRTELKEAPLSLLSSHWASGSGEIEAYVKAKKTLTQHCTFRAANLLDLKGGMSSSQKFDLIFCRNVFIYFNPDQIQSITKELLSRLIPEGYLFIGVSESLSGLSLPVEILGPSIYQHKDHVDKKKQVASNSPDIATRSGRPPTATAAGPIRVVCVDDSPSILALLKQILAKQHGFEIIGTAANGIEAQKTISTLKPDVVTLDIHMPEQTGIEYLEKNLKPGHPPVVMVTSVAREDAELAGRALLLGAADHVEKPALSNLTDRGEEIRNKVRCALTAGAPAPLPKTELEFQRKSVLVKTDDKLRLTVLPVSSRGKLKTLLRDLAGAQPPMILLVEGSKEALPAIAMALTRETGKNITAPDALPTTFRSSDILLFDLSTMAPKIWELHGRSKKVSVLVFGEVSKAGGAKLEAFKESQILLEDLGSGKGTESLAKIADDIVPATSFAYLSNEYFCQDDKKRKAA